jgi:hypothetical protein
MVPSEKDGSFQVNNKTTIFLFAFNPTDIYLDGMTLDRFCKGKYHPLDHILCTGHLFPVPIVPYPLIF